MCTRVLIAQADTLHRMLMDLSTCAGCHTALHRRTFVCVGVMCAFICPCVRVCSRALPYNVSVVCVCVCEREKCLRLYYTGLDEAIIILRNVLLHTRVLLVMNK